MGVVSKSIYQELRSKTRAAIRAGIRPATSKERRVYSQARRRAARTEGHLPFTLSPAEFDILVSRADGRCEDTGVAFSDRRQSRGPYRHPDYMSIDRLNNRRGYDFANVRLVTQALNFARGSMTMAECYRVMAFSLHHKGVQLRGADIISTDPDHDQWRF